MFTAKVASPKVRPVISPTVKGTVLIGVVPRPARDEDDARRRDEHPPDEQEPAAREPQEGRAPHHEAFLSEASAAKGFGRFSASVSGVLSS